MWHKLSLLSDSCQNTLLFMREHAGGHCQEVRRWHKNRFEYKSTNNHHLCFLNQCFMFRNIYSWAVLTSSIYSLCQFILILHYITKRNTTSFNPLLLSDFTEWASYTGYIVQCKGYFSYTVVLIQVWANNVVFSFKK